MISSAAIIGEQVAHGSGCRFEDFVVVGRYTSHDVNKDMTTSLGRDCIIRSHSIIYAGNVIGDRFKTGHHVVIRDHNRIGHDVSVGSLSNVEHHVVIGDGVRIHSQTFIPEFCELAAGAWIGPGVRLTNAKYPNSTDAKSNLAGVYVGERAVIGASAVILPGVQIGDRALIGAGSVVTKNVYAEAVVSGNPATVICMVDELPPQGDQDEKPYA